MDDLRTLIVARLIAGIGILLGAFYLVGDLLHAAPTHDRVPFIAPTDIGPHTLGLVERRADEELFVDVQYGPHTVEGAVSVTPNPERGGVYVRYGARFTLYAPRARDLPWKLVEVSPVGEVPSVRLIELPGEPPVATKIEAATLGELQTQVDQLTLGGVPRRIPLLPGPAWILLGAAVWLSAGTRRRPAFTPTVTLALVLAAIGVILCWPLVLHLGPGPSVPAAVLGLVITLAIAAAAGPKLQAITFERGRAGRAFLGALVGAILLGVFTMAAVNINGFIAPVFRPPGDGLSPAGWFMNDFVAPAAAIVGMGCVPALLCGAVYGLLGRRRVPAA